MGFFKQTYLNEREEVVPYYYWLSSLQSIGIKTYTKMQSFFASPRELYLASSESVRTSRVFNERQKNEIIESRKHFDIEKEYASLLDSKISFIVRESEEFPERLKEIPQSPVFIFMRGQLPNPGIPLVSIIGARDCSFYGTQVASRLGELFAEQGICVVSGMARGVDSLSQDACLKAGGTSIAVLGGGVDVIYPKESGALYETLSERGAIISEYFPGTNPQPSYFARRNRIISGLSDALCVIEAREKSGTMITVDAALEQGREVFALPGRITDSTSRGCNELIKQGAGVITDLETFVLEMSGNYRVLFTNNKDDKKAEKSDCFDKTINETINIEETRMDYETDCIIEGLSEAEKRAVILFDLDSFTAEQMASVIGTPPGEILVMCLNLSVKNVIINMGAGRFRLSKTGVRTREKLLKI